MSKIRFYSSGRVHVDMSVSELKALTRLKADMPFADAHYIMAQSQVRRDSLDGQMLDAVYAEAIYQRLEVLELLEKALFHDFDAEQRLNTIQKVMYRTGRMTSPSPISKPINPEEGD